MPILNKPRQEKFAQLVAAGQMRPVDAYAAAGFSPHHQNASRLMQNDAVQARVAEIQGAASNQVVEKLAITKERIARELARLAFYDIRDAVSWRSNAVQVGADPNTDEPVDRAFNEVQLVDSADLREDVARAISGVRQARDGSLTIKLAD
jgi:phage terminase small subunit